VEPIGVRQVLIGIKVVPTPSFSVPCEIQSLQASGLGFDEILLEGRYPHCSNDFEPSRPTSSAIRRNEEFAAAF